jgi:hypothetical protein
MNKMLKNLRIIQERKRIDSFKITRLEERFNPYNPLAYIFLLIMILIAIVLYGAVEVFKEERVIKPFKWH